METKGQGAMEYLMVYGWAILVVIVVGVVLYQFGVFEPYEGEKHYLYKGDVIDSRTISNTESCVDFCNDINMSYYKIENPFFSPTICKCLKHECNHFDFIRTDAECIMEFKFD